MCSTESHTLATNAPITIVHVLFRFGIGGLENGVVNLINGLDEASYRHCIVCLTDYDESFMRRLRTSNFEVRALHKRAGNDPRVWLRMWRILAEVRPDVLHTRNFAALELQLLGWLARVRGRVHGEHGWDVHDLDGSVRKYRIARRVIGTVVHQFIALSRDLERYLTARVGIAPSRVVQIYNGVDSGRFAPVGARERSPLVIGTVGRMKTVKNQTLLCRAFAGLLARRPDLAPRLRLRLVGSGPLQSDCEAIVARAGIAGLVDFCGDSDTVAEHMQAMDVFVLPSLAEGISNTILEAMACGLPIIAAAVGGNGELVADGDAGMLIANDDVGALMAALERYVDDPALRLRHGARARAIVEERFSLDRMLAAYDGVYRTLAACPA